MHKPLIALPVSQHFDSVFPELADIVGFLILRNVGSNPGKLRRPYKKAYHTGGFINTKFTENMNSECIGVLNNSGVSHISFDCGPSCMDVCPNPEDNDCYRPDSSSRVLEPDEIIDIAKDRMKFIKDRFCGTVALENLDYHKGGAYEHVCDPEFICRALKDLGVYLALDIGHAMVTAFGSGMKASDYIFRLPLELVKEVHISHPEGGNDKHDLPTSAEFDILEKVLMKSSPDFVVIEYYREPGKIIKANTELFKFLNS